MDGVRRDRAMEHRSASAACGLVSCLLVLLPLSAVRGQQFTDIVAGSGLTTYSWQQAWGDYNNDNYADLSCCLT